MILLTSTTYPSIGLVTCQDLLIKLVLYHVMVRVYVKSLSLLNTDKTVKPISILNALRLSWEYAEKIYKWYQIYKKSLYLRKAQILKLISPPSLSVFKGCCQPYRETFWFFIKFFIKLKINKKRLHKKMKFFLWPFIVHVNKYRVRNFRLHKNQFLL